MDAHQGAADQITGFSIVGTSSVASLPLLSVFHMAFAAGSAFHIGGVPVAEARPDLNVSRNATLDLSNRGQFECGRKYLN
jgi:hypothetical protein